MEGKRGADTSAAQAAGVSAPLPCLLRNNCDGDSVKVCGKDRKRAEATRQNIAHFQRQTGLATGVLTITFAEDLPTRDAQKKLHNFRRRVLGGDNFGPSISVREFTFRGRPHFHLVVDCLGDITSGFNWQHHEAVTAWSKEGRKGAKPHGSLNRTPRLVALHQLLADKGRKYGIGRMELVPVKKAEAIGFYLGGYLAKSLGNKPQDAKGTRAVNYSRKCPRIFSGQWSWANEAGWLWRAKLSKWAASHGCASFGDVHALFGPRWAYHHREAIRSTELDYYPSGAHYIADGKRWGWQGTRIEDVGEIHISRPDVEPGHSVWTRERRQELEAMGIKLPPAPPPRAAPPIEREPGRSYQLQTREEISTRRGLHPLHSQRSLRV